MSEWIEITDPQSQNTFYANPLTGECCWDKPATGKIKPKDPTGEWWELYDENHKLPYYYNTITGQTEWLQPTTGTIIPLIAIQNSAIGKRMSVALQRNSGSYEDWNASRPPAHIIPVPLDNSTSGDIQPKQAENGPNFAQSPLRQSASNTEITPDAWNSPIHDKNTRRYTMKESPQLVSAAKSGAAAEIARRGGVGDPSLNPSAAIQMSPVHNHSGGSTTPYIPPADARISAKTLPTELRSDISQFKIDGFAKKYFSTHKHGIFRRTVPVEKMLLWSKDSLRLPLIVLNKSVHKDALKCYKNIQRIMGDRSRPRGGNVNDEIQWLLNKGILHGELRDEIYVQLCKQLTENPTADSICKGWELMCVITITFPPSKNFENYLQTFIRQHEEDSQKKVEMFAKHAASRLKRICKIGPRGKVLTVAEIDRAKEAPFRPSVFGETLEAIMKAQRERYTELYLPRILPFLAESILKLGGQRTEGIFRVPGDADEVTELKVRLENGKYDVSGITDPNVPSSLFKLWLRELAEPLIPEETYADCVRYAEDVPRAVSIVDQLPETNKRIVHYVINFLQLFAKPETIESTKMNVGNLAMVFAPNFLRCPSENLTLIFENTKFEQAFMRSLITNLTNAPEDMRL